MSGSSASQLIKACQAKDLDAVMRICGGGGVDVNGRDAEGRTPLTVTAANGDRRLLEYLLEIPDLLVSLPGEGGHPALHLAAFRGDAWMVQRLLTVPGAGLANLDGDGDSALHAAVGSHAWDEMVVACVQLLLVHPHINPAVVNEDGETALFPAVLRKYATVAELLVAQHPQLVGMADYYGNTPLHEAALFGRPKMCTLLLKSGADPTVRNKAGMRPLDLATDSPCQEALARATEKAEQDKLRPDRRRNSERRLASG